MVQCSVLQTSYRLCHNPPNLQKRAVIISHQQSLQTSTKGHFLPINKFLLKQLLLQVNTFPISFQSNMKGGQGYMGYHWITWDLVLIIIPYGSYPCIQSHQERMVKGSSGVLGDPLALSPVFYKIKLPNIQFPLIIFSPVLNRYLIPSFHN